MDFDYVEENRPSFRLQSGGGAAPKEAGNVDRKQAVVCIGIGLALVLCCAWITGIAQLVAAWLGLSLLLGPFAPISLTAGDCRVGQGEILPPVISSTDSSIGDAEKKNVARSRKQVKNRSVDFAAEVEEVKGEQIRKQGSRSLENVSSQTKKSDGEWSQEEIAMLKKQMAKHPRGTARRWQVIADSFNGSRTVDNVIQMAKDLSEKKHGDEDAYATFLAQRKVSSKQISSDSTLRKDFDDETIEEMVGNGTCNGIGNGNESHQVLAWSEKDDKALLGALRTFPKDTPQRWEKISAAVDGRSKSQCMKRYLELRDGFRSSKVQSAHERQADI